MIRIDISKDALEAMLTIQASGDDYPTLDEVLFELDNRGVVTGIDLDLIKRILSQKEPVRKVLIAKGVPPKYGKDGELQWLIGINKPLENTSDNANRIDFKNTKFSQGVKANEILVKRIPPENGTDGLSVFNTIISSFGQDYELPKGRNTHISEDGTILYADINGSAFLENGKINVDEIYHVKGNVSYATGNIKFDGPVVIDGDVLSGFRVEAKDSIYVSGNIEAANVYSHQGDITVQYGILGKGRAKILAGGNLKCGFIQDATVGVRKDVIVDHYILNGIVTAGGKVEATQNEGLIRGGNVTAEKGIIVKDAGSDRNTYTELHIMNQGENESQSALWEISKIRSELSVRLSSLKKRLSFLEVLELRLKGLSDDKIAEKVFLTGEIKRVSKKIESLNEQELTLQKEASKERITREIVVHGTIYKNVNIDISGLGYHCEEPMHSVKFYRFKREIIVESLLDMNDSSYDIFIPTKTD